MCYREWGPHYKTPYLDFAVEEYPGLHIVHLNFNKMPEFKVVKEFIEQIKYTRPSKNGVALIVTTDKNRRFTIRKKALKLMGGKLDLSKRVAKFQEVNGWVDYEGKYQPFKDGGNRVEFVGFDFQAEGDLLGIGDTDED